MNKIEDYLGIANHDIQVANDNKELINYVASILCEIDDLQQENNKFKKIIDNLREYMLDIDYKMGWQYAEYLNKLLEEKEK